MSISRAQDRIKPIRAHYLLGITFTATIFSLLPSSPLDPPWESLLLFPILGFRGHEKQLFFFSWKKIRFTQIIPPELPNLVIIQDFLVV